MKTRVIVTLQVEGIHKWSSCPLDEVYFLRFDHRHLFHIKAKKEVFHDDRDVEIILLKREIERWLNALFYRQGSCYFGEMSCEMIAKQILIAFDLDECEVLEDGENGAVVTKL